jgi:putative spermidine/putrescine transport system ATP-binding protein
MTNSPLDLVGVTRKFKDTVALDNLDLHVGSGELVSLLGPSGCGKTTALRIIAGLDKADRGQLLLNEVDITDVPAHKRNMSMVFQAYSLFPNLTAAENVAFGLQMRKVSKGKRRNKAYELLELVGLPTHSHRFTHQLSGGQQQRVALARALAIEPEVLLLDEPLSALDAKVRTNLREEIRRLQLSLGTTTIFVTHDQEEAMAVSDRVAVMNKGRIEQIASPDALYNAPATSFVASFIGSMNKIAATKTGSKLFLVGRTMLAAKSGPAIEGPVVALVRPESVQLIANEKSDIVVLNRSFLGPVSRITCRLVDGSLINSMMSSAASAIFRPGDRVDVRLLDKEVLYQAEEL